MGHKFIGCTRDNVKIGGIPTTPHEMQSHWTSNSVYEINVNVVVSAYQRNIYCGGCVNVVHFVGRSYNVVAGECPRFAAVRKRAHCNPVAVFSPSPHGSVFNRNESLVYPFLFYSHVVVGCDKNHVVLFPCFELVKFGQCITFKFKSHVSKMFFIKIKPAPIATTRFSKNGDNRAVASVASVASVACLFRKMM